VLIVFVMEQRVSNDRFLTWRAGDKKRVCWRFCRYNSIVLILARLVVAVGPPMTVLVWCETTVIVMLFVSGVTMCSIGTRKRLGQFENSKLRLAKLLQPVKSIVI
jgi:cytochrome b subunit of formate dehydrogenase